MRIDFRFLPLFFGAVLLCSIAKTEEGEMPMQPEWDRLEQLRYACENLEPALAKGPLAAGVSPDSLFPDGTRPLLQVMRQRFNVSSPELQRESLRLMEMLLQHGARLDLEPDGENNPISLALYLSDMESWRLFRRFHSPSELLAMAGWRQTEPRPLSVDGRKTLLVAPEGMVESDEWKKLLLALAGQKAETAADSVFFAIAPKAERTDGKTWYAAFIPRPQAPSGREGTHRLLPAFIHNSTYSWDFDTAVLNAGFPHESLANFGIEIPGEDCTLVLCRDYFPGEKEHPFLLVLLQTGAEEYVSNEDFAITGKTMLSWCIAMQAVNNDAGIGGR